MIAAFAIFLLVSAALLLAALICVKPLWGRFRSRAHPWRAFGVLVVGWFIVFVGLLIPTTAQVAPTTQAAAATPATTSAPEPQPTQTPPQPTPTTAAPTTTSHAHSSLGTLIATGTVTKVTDGDTVHVSADGKDIDVRVLGINTPETVDPGKPVQCWGPQASAYAHSQLAGKTVSLYADPAQARTDKYGRALAYVIEPDGTNYSLAAVKSGNAQEYVYDDNPVSIDEKLLQAQSQAQSHSRGLWGSPCFGDTTDPTTQPAQPTTQPASPPVDPNVNINPPGNGYVSGPGVNCGLHGCHAHILPHFGWHW